MYVSSPDDEADHCEWWTYRDLPRPTVDQIDMGLKISCAPFLESILSDVGYAAPCTLSRGRATYLMCPHAPGLL